jgi:hypothetical protein
MGTLRWLSTSIHHFILLLRENYQGNSVMSETRSTKKRPSDELKVFLYLPKGIQAEIERFRRRHGLPSTSAAGRAMLRFAAVTMKDLDRMDQAGAYLAFVEAEQPVRLDPDV